MSFSQSGLDDDKVKEPLVFNVALGDRTTPLPLHIVKTCFLHITTYQIGGKGGKLSVYYSSFLCLHISSVRYQ